MKKSKYKRGPSKASLKRAQQAYEIIRANELGINRCLLARIMELPRANNGAIESILMSCDAHGLLTSEDNKGNIYAFEERGLYVSQEWDCWR